MTGGADTDDHPVFEGDEPRSPGEETVRRPRRRLRLAAVALAVVALLVVGIGAGYLLFLNNTVSNNLTYEPLMPDGTEPVTTESGTVLPRPVDRPETAGDALNYLVIGTDARDPDGERGRSDVIVLVHISDDRERVDLIHFPRDYFVDIPGSSRPNKINAAFAIGGAPLLVETIQPLIGVPIDSVAIVDFESFKSLTNAVGGVEVNVAEASPGFPVGTMEMDGETGLEFVRERYELSQGDISRGQRQQAFIKGVMLKTLSRETVTNPAQLSNVVDAATKNLTVDENLDIGRMRSLAFSMRGVRGEDIHFVTAPWEGLGSDPVAGSIVVPATDQLDDLAKHLQNDTMGSYEDDVSPQTGFSN